MGGRVLPRDAYLPALLLAGFAAIWAALAIEPVHRQGWLLENVLVFAGVPLLCRSYRTLRFSDLSHACLFVFLGLQEVGAHATLFEIVEAAAAGIFGAELGRTDPGTQGGVRDSHRDSALAALGAAIAHWVCRRFPAVHAGGHDRLAASVPGRA